MKIKAKISFCGALCMTQGEVKECNDDVVLQDLLQAGYVEPAEVVRDESKRDNSTKRSKLPKA